MKQMKNPMTLEVDCVKCGSTTNLVIEQDDLKRYTNKEGSAQKIFSYLSPEERELIISGICPTCWNKIFKNNK